MLISLDNYKPPPPCFHKLHEILDFLINRTVVFYGNEGDYFILPSMLEMAPVLFRAGENVCSPRRAAKRGACGWVSSPGSPPGVRGRAARMWISGHGPRVINTGLRRKWDSWDKQLQREISCPSVSSYAKSHFSMTLFSGLRFT